MTTTEIYTLSLHDALPIFDHIPVSHLGAGKRHTQLFETQLKELRSEEHTSELQSRENLVCRLLLEKKKAVNLTPFVKTYVINLTSRDMMHIILCCYAVVIF